MRLWRAFFIRVVGCFATRKRERDLSAEIRSHFEMHVEDNLRAGMSPAEARRSAVLQFGGVESVKEAIRERARLAPLATTMQDLRYAWRGLRQNPSFAITAILSLAVGLGASLAIYTVADNLLLRPLPYPHSLQLVMIWEEHPAKGYRHGIVAPRNYFAWKGRTHAFQDMAVLSNGQAVLNDGQRTEELQEVEAAANLLPLLGVHPVRGRLLTAGDDRRGADPVMLISYRLWRSWFGGDEKTIGRRVLFGGKARTIVGVLPSNFYFRDRTVDVWYPLGLNPAENSGDGRWLWCVARLKSGVTFKQAQNEMSALARQLEIEDPRFNAGWTHRLEPLRDSLVREVKPSLLVLLGAVGLLLAVACANVANLLLARYTARRREMAVRASLGAGRSRVIRQLLTESVLLGLLGGLLGMLLAKWSVAGLLLLAPKDLTQSIEVVTDIRIYIFAAGLSILTSIFFGLVPALASSRIDLAQALHDDGRTSVGTRTNIRSWLVATEVALSVILLSGAMLLFRTLAGLQSVNPGINPTNLLTLRTSLPGAHYSKPSQKIQFFTRALQEINSLPGVRSASAVSHVPFNGMAPGTWVHIAGRPLPKPGEEIVAIIRTVLPGYFRTMGIPLSSGRDFTAADNTEKTPHRFIVNEAFARKYLRGENPLDQQLQVWMEEQNPFGPIIGVVGDVKEDTLDKEPTPTVYYPHAHLAYNRMVFMVRAQHNPLALIEPIRRIVRTIDPAQPIADVRTMDEIIGDTFSRQHFSMLLLSGFSLASVLLAAIGIYGVLAYSVSARTREIGVRVALGAEPGRIVSLIVRGGAQLVICGVLAGIGGALALTGLLRSMLFGVSPRDPVTFVMAPAILVVVALMAAYLPARRAAHLDPMEALRMD